MFTGNTFCPSPPAGLITEYNIAAEGLLKAFMEYRKADGILCEAGQYQESVLKRFMDEEDMVSFGKRIKLVNEYEILFHGLNRHININILHSVKEDVLQSLSLHY